MLDISKRSAVACLFPVFAALLACADGGANEGQRGPGDQPGGVALGLGDIAVAPTDAYVVFSRDDSLAVGWTGSGAVETLPVDAPTRLAFSKQRNVVYVGSTQGADRVVAVDLEKQAVLWGASVPDARTSILRVLATDDDRFVLAGDAATGDIHVIDAATGAEERTFSLGDEIVDLRILPGNERALAVLDDTWSGGKVTTAVRVLTIATGGVTSISVPNCSDRVALTQDGTRALLAPTTCVDPASAKAKDPISVLDLTPGKERFVRNLPGFGPVAVAPTGTLAVGFLDRDAIDASLFDDASLIPDENTARYHLMLLDTNRLTYDFVEVGESLPRFAVTPDGNVLLVDSSWTFRNPARLFDVEHRAWRDIRGEQVVFSNFALSSDSRHAYVIESLPHEGFYDLDIGTGVSANVPLDFAPTNINIAPSDETLYLRKSHSEVCVYSLAERRCRTTLDAEKPRVTP